jgi:uncharacterized protein with HEPN domain
MNDRDLKTLKRIIRHIESIIDYMKPIQTLDEFTDSQLIVDAVVFNLAQIGELSKNKISSSLKQEYKDIPWFDIYGFRNRIIHDYDQIIMSIVYDTIIEDLPPLLEQLKNLIFFRPDK